MSERLDEVLRVMRGKLMQEHNVAIAPADPLLMAMSANLIIIEEAIKVSEELQREALEVHRSELHMLTSQWAKEAQACADTIVKRMQEASVEATADSIEALCDGASVRIEEALAKHERTLRMAAWTSALAVAVAVLAATATMLQH